MSKCVVSYLIYILMFEENIHLPPLVSNLIINSK